MPEASHEVEVASEPDPANGLHGLAGAAARGPVSRGRRDVLATSWSCMTAVAHGPFGII